MQTCIRTFAGFNSEFSEDCNPMSACNFHRMCGIPSYTVHIQRRPHRYPRLQCSRFWPSGRSHFPHDQAGGTTVFERLAADAARKGAGSSVGDHGMRRTVSTKHGLSVGATRPGGAGRCAQPLYYFSSCTVRSGLVFSSRPPPSAQ